METANKFDIYNRYQSCVFCKTKEEYGGLSNMAAGYVIEVNGISILTSEALYQACRFPHSPEIQKKIIEQISPMAAKMVSKPYRYQSRKDWSNIRVDVMRWCLRVKLAQNFANFGELLESTGSKPIVEESYSDTFWGAIKTGDETLKGTNVLGRLLVELREEYSSLKEHGVNSYQVEPLILKDFSIYGNPIQVIYGRKSSQRPIEDPNKTTKQNIQIKLFS